MVAYGVLIFIIVLQSLGLAITNTVVADVYCLTIIL